MKPQNPPPVMTPERRALISQRRKEAHERQIHDLFWGRKFDIVRTVHLPKGQVFITCLGMPVRHGYVLQDRETGQQLAVGTTLLRRIHDRYYAVRLPYRPLKKMLKPKIRRKRQTGA